MLAGWHSPHAAAGAVFDNIRDVIAFPKTQKASDLMTGAPATVETKQLVELGIRAVVPPKPDSRKPVE